MGHEGSNLRQNLVVLAAAKKRVMRIYGLRKVWVGKSLSVRDQFKFNKGCDLSPTCQVTNSLPRHV